MKDYYKTWVEWVEPFSEYTGSDAVHMKVRASTAILLMKKLKGDMLDEDALMDFIAVHWANITEEK